MHSLNIFTLLDSNLNSVAVFRGGRPFYKCRPYFLSDLLRRHILRRFWKLVLHVFIVYDMYFNTLLLRNSPNIFIKMTNARPIL